MLAEIKRIAGWCIVERLNKALPKYGTLLTQFKSSVEKDKLSALKLECSGVRTEDERQCKWLFEVGFNQLSQQKL